jgi:glycosyltransferase involved in cell wall biosynthesis
MAGELFDAAMRAARRGQPLAFHGHDLNTCYAALAAARTTGAHFIADFHEWTSENVHWNAAAQAWTPYPDEWKAELKALETRIMSEASAVVTVSDAIVDALARELGQGRRATLVRNIPSLTATPTQDYPPLKQQLGLPENRFVLLWQGGTGPTRLIEPIIEALAFAPGCTLVIRGPSLDLFGPAYRAIADRVGAGDRLILKESVPSRDVVAAGRGADAGIWTLPALCRNFTYALPNKIFEYMAAGLPTLAADYPEARRVVQGNEIGDLFDPYSPQSIALAINRLIDDPALCERLRRNTVTALSSLDAESEWCRLVNLYDELPRALA